MEDAEFTAGWHRGRLEIKREVLKLCKKHIKFRRDNKNRVAACALEWFLQEFLEGEVIATSIGEELPLNRKELT